MTRALVRAAIFLGSAALGLWIASIVVPDMSVGWRSFIVVVVVFALLQLALTPMVTALAERNASAIVGAAGLISTVVALLVTSWLLDGLTIDGGVGSWVYAAVVVWLVTMVAALLLPMLFRRGDREARGRRAAA